MGTAIDMAFGGATLAACPLSALVLSFAFYGFCGWVWESTVCAMLNHGRFANSGFLLGPCCPIYGAGGIACWLLLRGIPDASSQFVAAALVCSVIEYSVGVLLEKQRALAFGITRTCRLTCTDASVCTGLARLAWVRCVFAV